MGHLFRHIQGHIAGLFRPGLLPSGREASSGALPEYEITWADGTAATWADGMQMTWS